MFVLRFHTIDRLQSDKEGNCSVGACYFVVNNLPWHLSFLRKNIHLAVVFPGPNEPNDYMLHQMLEPIVQEQLELQSGTCMCRNLESK